MNKTLLLSAAVLLLGGSAEARNWNFNNWSAETINNLKADENWSEDEKGNGTIFEGCYWFKAPNLAAATDSEGNLVANGVAIKELVGLQITEFGSGGVAIAVDYQDTKDGNPWGDFNGPQYLWFSGTFHVKIPQVAPGTTITAGVETHKKPKSGGADPRGIDMYVGGNKVSWTSEQTGYPTSFDEYTWVVPGEEGGDPVDVEFWQSKGCHVYYFHTDEKDNTEIPAEEVSVAYLYDATYNGAKTSDKTPCGWLANGGLDADPIFEVLSNFDVTPIDYSTCQLTSDQLNDSLIKFDVVVLGECVSSSNGLAKGTFNVVNKVPMLNLKSFFYKNGVWSVGAGVNPSWKADTLFVKEDYLEDPLFTNVNWAENGGIIMFDYDGESTVNGNLLQAYSLSAGSYFEGDEVIATAGGVSAIHSHGTRNRYLLLPISSDNMDKLTSDASLIVFNAVTELAKTKSAVQKASMPSATLAMEHLSTTVTLSCGTPGSTIYYTVDGTEPTTASSVYSEPFVVNTDGTVVKAFAVARGFDPSDVLTKEISVKAKLSAPRIVVDERDGQTVITLYNAINQPANIYYSFLDVNEVSKASLYTEPLVVTDASTIYAFAEWATALQSETVHQSFTVGGVPAIKDTVAHFSPDADSWGEKVLIYKADTLVGTWEQSVAVGLSKFKSNSYYHIGDKALPYYTDELDYEEYVQNAETGQTDTIKHYKRDLNAHTEIFSTVNTGWVVKTDGQVVTTEKTTAVARVGNGETGYYAEAAIDLITGGPKCKGLMDFGGKYSGAPYNMSVETTEKLTAPFYVETYLGNGSNKPGDAMEIQVSADGVEWQAIQVLNYATNQRYWKRTKVHFSESGEYYVRVAQVGNFSKPQLYDVFVMTTDGLTGIENLANDKAAKSETIYDFQGRRVTKMVPGQLYIENGKKVIVR